MDVDWSHRVTRYLTGSYKKDKRQFWVINNVAELRDPRICPATVTRLPDDEVLIEMPRVTGHSIAEDWHRVPCFDELKTWCEDLYEYLADLGVIAYDITSGNVMLTEDGNYILVDYEQFKEYTDELYEKQKRWMYKQIHEVGAEILCAK